MICILLTDKGLDRVLNGEIGMTFMVEKFTGSPNGKVAHIRDYRFSSPSEGHDYAVWSIPFGGWQEVLP